MPDLSVVVPVHNERGNIVPLLTEIASALRGKADFEVVYVDDASRDDTLTVMTAAKAQFPELRILRHLTQSGQSTAVRTGVKAARGSPMPCAAVCCTTTPPTPAVASNCSNVRPFWICRISTTCIVICPP